MTFPSPSFNAQFQVVCTLIQEIIILTVIVLSCFTLNMKLLRVSEILSFIVFSFKKCDPVLKVESKTVIVNNLSYETNKCLFSDNTNIQVNIAWYIYKNVLGLHNSWRNRTLSVVIRISIEIHGVLSLL